MNQLIYFMSLDGAPPPSPVIQASTIGTTGFSITLTPRVPITAISTFLINITQVDPYLPLFTQAVLGPSLTTSISLLYSTEYNISVFATNVYGDGDTAYVTLMSEGSTLPFPLFLLSLHSPPLVIQYRLGP
jgi:hypothetical protein